MGSVRISNGSATSPTHPNPCEILHCAGKVLVQGKILRANSTSCCLLALIDLVLFAHVGFCSST